MHLGADTFLDDKVSTNEMQVQAHLNHGIFYGRGTNEFRSVSERRKFFVWQDSNRWSGDPLRERADSRATQGASPAPCASLHRDGQGFFDGAAMRKALSQGAVGFQDHDQGFLQVSFGFRQGTTLRIDAGDFFDVANMPFSALHIDGCKLSDHSDIVTEMRGSLKALGPVPFPSSYRWGQSPVEDGFHRGDVKGRVCS